MKVSHIIGLVSLIFPVQAYAEGCEDYQYTGGIQVEDVSGGTKIISTGSAAVSFDDVDSIKDAREEATLEAKTQISQFLTDGIHSDQTINKVVNESKSMKGQSKSVSRSETVTRLKNMGSHSEALLRGVIPFGECYTKGKELRVTVGIKPETINSAGNTARGINESLNSDMRSQNTEPMNSEPLPQKGSGQGLNGSNSYNRLNKF